MNKTKNCDSEDLKEDLKEKKCGCGTLLLNNKCPYGHSEDLKKCGCGTLLLNNKCPRGHSEDLKECGCGTRLKHNKCPHGHSSEDLKGKRNYKGLKMCGGCGTLLAYNRCPHDKCDWRNW
jgi:hypothetical protein